MRQSLMKERVKRNCRRVGRRAFLESVGFLRRSARHGEEIKAALSRKGAKILVIRLDRVGDAVLSLPFLRELKRAFPEAEIHVLGSPCNFQIFAGLPYLRAVHLLERGIAAGLRTAVVMRRQRFDLIIELETSRLQGPLMAYLSGGTASIGMDDRGVLKRKGRGILFTNPVPPAPDTETKWFVQQTFDLLRVLGLKPKNDGYERITILPEAEEYLRGLTARQQVETDLWVGIIPGSSPIGEPGRQWAAANFQELMDRIYAETGAFLLLLGGAQDVSFSNRILSGLKGPALNLVGKTDLQQLTAVIDQCQLVIGSCSGPIHIARAMQTPSICLVGPSSISRWHRGLSLPPYHRVVSKNLPCSPCDSRFCPFTVHRCITSITVDEVMATFHEIRMASQVKPPRHEFGLRTAKCQNSI